MEFFTIINFVLIVFGLVIGFIISKLLEKTSITKSFENAKKEAENILKSASIEGENIKKDKIFQAKEKFLELKSEHEKHILSREKNLTDVQKRIKDKESQVSNELSINKE
jgi:ribonuclease Y